MRDYLGVDWADAEHAVWVEDDAAAKVLSRTVPQTVEGLADFGRWLDERRAAGRELWAAIEKPEGRIVDFLLDHGVVVFPINPKAVDRARDRFRMSGAKSDSFDARVLAGFLRTDHGHLSPLRPSSEAAQELKGLTRDYTRQVRQQTRLLNQLTTALKAYYPRALEVAEDLTSAWGRAFLRAHPTPAALAQLTERRWQRWARPHRLSDERTTSCGRSSPARSWPCPRMSCGSTSGACSPGSTSWTSPSTRSRRIGRRSPIFSPVCRPRRGCGRCRAAGAGPPCPACTLSLGMRPAAGRPSAISKGMPGPSPSPTAVVSTSS